jgi:hypothetical protein
MMGTAQRVELDGLDDALQSAPEPLAELLRKVIAVASARRPLLRRAATESRIKRLVAAGAWTEAAFALIELEMPDWTLRRVVYEDGEWLCSLSRRPSLPLALDDTVDGRHETLPLALLRAFVDARRGSATTQEIASSVPQVRPTSDQMLCCDNFS